jgi:hypothetical protein
MIALLANPIVKWFGIGSLITITLLTAALGITRNTLANVRQANKLAEQARIAEAVKREMAWAQAAATATEQHAEAVRNLQPIIIRSNNEVTRYAQTPNGRALCLAADRVRGIDGFDTDIAAATATGLAAVPDTASASPK